MGFQGTILGPLLWNICLRHRNNRNEPPPPRTKICRRPFDLQDVPHHHFQRRLIQRPPQLQIFHPPLGRQKRSSFRHTKKRVCHSTPLPRPRRHLQAARTPHRPQTHHVHCYHKNHQQSTAQTQSNLTHLTTPNASFSRNTKLTCFQSSNLPTVLSTTHPLLSFHP